MLTFRWRMIRLVLIHTGMLLLFVLWEYVLAGAIWPVGLVLLSLTLSLPCVLAFWAAFGGRPGPWRLVLVTAVLAVCAMLGMSLLPDQTPDWARAAKVVGVTLASLPGCFVASTLSLLTLRLVGLTLAESDLESQPPGREHPPQFSLGSLLEWVAATAIVLGLLSTVFRRIGLDPVTLNAEFSETIPVPLLTLAAFGTYSLWVAVATRLSRVVHGLLLGGLCVFNIFSIGRAAASPSIMALSMIIVFTAAGGVEGSIKFLHEEGIRITWKGKITKASKAADAPRGAKQLQPERQGLHPAYRLGRCLGALIGR